MEAFSKLSRKDKVKLFRKRAEEMQCRKDGQIVEQCMRVANKAGKLGSMEKYVEAPVVIRTITFDEMRLWDQVVNESESKIGEGLYCARVPIKENDAMIK